MQSVCNICYRSLSGEIIVSKWACWWCFCHATGACELSSKHCGFCSVLLALCPETAPLDDSLDIVQSLEAKDFIIDQSATDFLNLLNSYKMSECSKKNMGGYIYIYKSYCCWFSQSTCSLTLLYPHLEKNTQLSCGWIFLLYFQPHLLFLDLN